MAGLIDLFSTRTASIGDISTISGIYNQGISDRIATFETRLRKPDDIKDWINSGFPVVVGVLNGVVVSFAAAFSYSHRECYRGIAEFSVYVERELRNKGYGRPTMQRLMDEAAKSGLWKLLSRIFPENTASRRLLNSLGFREVGFYEKHGKLDNEWKDVIIVERLFPENQP